MIIGTFTYNETSDLYAGEIRTLTLHHPHVEFRPAPGATNQAPDYRVVTETGGSVVEFGAAWRRVSERGQPFVSVVLDDPALPGACHAALFRADGEATANLVWSRSSAKTKRPEPERPVAAARPARRNRRRAEP